jgi:hypothetical protein
MGPNNNGAEPMIEIGEVAKMVDRKPATIRKWERDGDLPAVLMASGTNARNRRIYTQQQAQGIRVFVEDLARYPGSGLKTGYKPTAQQRSEHVHHMRVS